MASRPSSNLPVPVTPSAEADDGVPTQNVEGRVRESMVNHLRRLVDKDPEAVVGGMRRWLHDDS